MTAAVKANSQVSIYPSKRRKGMWDLFVGGSHRITKPTLKGAIGYARRLGLDPGDEIVVRDAGGAEREVYRVRELKNPEPDLEDIFEPGKAAAALAIGSLVPGAAVVMTAGQLADAVDEGILDEAAEVVMGPMRAIGEGTVGLVANGARRGSRRRNPEEDAAEMFEEFHGSPSTREEIFIGDYHEHDHLAELGPLMELKVLTVTGRDAEIAFSQDEEPDSDTPLLCSNEEGTQLYIIGGDQSLRMSDLGMSAAKWDKDLVVIGIVYELTYRTRKGFDKFQLTDYYHSLGEETLGREGYPKNARDVLGVQPVLLYSTRDQKMGIAGGTYTIRAEGITD